MRTWAACIALVFGAIAANPLSAQAGDIGGISRGGGEASTQLGKRGAEWIGDGFSLRMTSRVQIRLTAQDERANGSDGSNGRDFINFRVRRARTAFSGHIFNEEIQYKLQLRWESSTLIDHAWLMWAADKKFNIAAGQHKPNFGWEHTTSSGNQQFVDRGYVNSVFSQDYNKGVWIAGQLEGDLPWLRYEAGIYNGVLRGNTDFRSSDRSQRADTFSNFVDTEMMLNARIETHPLGRLPYSMNDARSEDDRGVPLVAFGLGATWFMSGFDAPGLRPDTAATPTASGRLRTSHDTLAITADAHLRWHGFSVDAAFYWRHTEFHNRGANRFKPTEPARNGISDLTDSGVTLEAAYFVVPQEVSVGIRYGYLNADEFWQGGSNRGFAVRPDTTELGASANYYIHGNNLKLTFDVLYVSQQLAVPAQGSLLGVYNSPPARGAFGGSGENADYNDLWIARLQLQWIF